MSRTTLIRHIGGTSKDRMDVIVRTISNKLIAYGRAIINKAIKTKETDRETGAQENAYCAGVYYNGELRVMAFANAAPQEVPKNGHYWGHKMAKKFLTTDFHPELAGFCLVVANVMWYSWIQEEGLLTKKGIRQWRILSQEYVGLTDALRKLKDEYPKLKIRGKVTTTLTY